VPYRKAVAAAIALAVLVLTPGGCMRPLDTEEHLYEGLKVPPPCVPLVGMSGYCYF
jgi:hypothetical protein